MTTESRIDAELATLLADELSCVSSSWSLGGFGALAEFHHTKISQRDGLTVAAPLGGIAIENAPFLPVAYEVPSGRPGSWMHGLALCLRAPEAQMHRRQVITSLGMDGAAIEPSDRHALMFDLGLGLAHFDFCLRTSDAEVISSLKVHEGTALLGNSDLFAFLQKSSPQRILISRAGRIEVRSPIPAEKEHSPEGPHTHLLPSLLRSGRNHAATLPIPDGWVPCLYLYPPHPMQNSIGCNQPFNNRSHSHFQELMHRYGQPVQLHAKRAVIEAIEANEAPIDKPEFESRHARLAARVAVRQIAAQGCTASALAHWQRFLDGPGQSV